MLASTITSLFAAMTGLLTSGTIAFVATGLVGLVIVIITLALTERAHLNRSQPGSRFWTFYGINDRLYRNADKKRLHWSRERFRHHKFRWQSEP
jgi:hypothetical protein